MVWNAENRLERVEDSAEGWKETYVYDADGGRVAKKYWNGSTTSTTLYVNGMWERDIDSGVDTIQLSHAGRYVASYTKGPGTSTDLQWHFTDHLGSPVASGDLHPEPVEGPTCSPLEADAARYMTIGGRSERQTGRPIRSATPVTLRSPVT